MFCHLLMILCALLLIRRVSCLQENVPLVGIRAMIHLALHFRWNHLDNVSMNIFGARIGFVGF